MPLNESSGTGDFRKQISIVLIGHVNSGKSTITGNILYMCGGVKKTHIMGLEKEAIEVSYNCENVV